MQQPLRKIVDELVDTEWDKRDAHVVIYDVWRVWTYGLRTAVYRSIMLCDGVVFPCPLLCKAAQSCVTSQHVFNK